MSNITAAMAKARAHIEADLLERAADEPAFRNLLKTNPHAALMVLYGSDPVPSMKITVVEERAGEIVLVLPREIAEDELPDDLLDLASGGAYKGCKGDGWTLQKVERLNPGQ